MLENTFVFSFEFYTCLETEIELPFIPQHRNKTDKK